jgi:hypothetical protein
MGIESSSGNQEHEPKMTRREFLASIAGGLGYLKEYIKTPDDKKEEKEKDEKKEKPALTDDGSKEAKNFVKAWEVKPANFKPPDGKDFIRSRVHVRKSDTNNAGQVDVDIYNRAAFVTKDEYKKPVQIDFQLMWKNEVEDKDKVKPALTYGDQPTVVLRTSGKFFDQRYWEVLDGYVIRFSEADRDVRVLKVRIDGNNKPTQDILKQETVNLQEANFESVRITDDGSVIRVYVGAMDKPVIEFDTGTVGDDGTTPKRHIAFYNREPTAAGGKTGLVSHKMTLMEPKISELKKE